VSLEAIKSIGAAEDEARQAKISAQQKAREDVEEAEKNGKESLASMVANAESEIAELNLTFDQKAATQAAEIVSTTANRQATLRARAEGRLEKAAQLIVERIVNV
jgi:V/A-type H+-transporting ATPase subunit G/H